ncbi:hypothetical protein FRC05_007167 [Tulasnella sp. 425]|nr:hypothetical protein FRC05_007167 [Tulasnella sp. 425]
MSTLAMQRGHAHRATFVLGITFSTIIFLNAFFQALLIFMRFASSVPNPAWSGLRILAAAIEWLFLIPGILLTASLGGRYDMDLIGGCVGEPKEGYDVTLFVNILVKACKSRTTRQENPRTSGPTRPHPSHSTTNTPNLGSDGNRIYDTPAAGPPTGITPKQGSEDLEKASSLQEKKVDGGATPAPSSESDVESSPAASLYLPSPPSLARVAMTRTNGMKR